MPPFVGKWNYEWGIIVMKKRGYTHIDKMGKEIDQMIKEGKTQREIATFFGFKDKTVIHQYLKRQRRKKELVNNSQ